MTSYPEDVGIEMLRNHCFIVRICRIYRDDGRPYGRYESQYGLVSFTC
jgi:hypothetical protein